MREESDESQRFLGIPETRIRPSGWQRFRNSKRIPWTGRVGFRRCLNEHADPPRYLTRTLQRYIDGMLLYSENMYADRGPDPFDKTRTTQRSSLMADHLAPATRWAFGGSCRRRGEVKPNRKFSDFILGGLWPGPRQVRGRAQPARSARSLKPRVQARVTSVHLHPRSSATTMAHMIEAMHVTYQGDSKAVEAQADLFASMADCDRRMRSHCRRCANADGRHRPTKRTKQFRRSSIARVAGSAPGRCCR